MSRPDAPSNKRRTNSEQRYLTSTTAPASVNFFLMVSASSFETPSLMLLGAPSTRSFASFKPRLVTSRTALITLILLAPTSFRTTVNSVFSSAAAAPAPAAPATITGAAAAADTPKASSIFFTRSEASSSVRPLISSRIDSTLLAIAMCILLKDKKRDVQNLTEPFQATAFFPLLHCPTQTCSLLPPHLLRPRDCAEPPL